MNENKRPCPQFPYWGAKYPDACCVNGELYDLDRCDENGNLYEPKTTFRVHFAKQKILSN